ncbi:MAG: cytidine/deoxycytidylate deaminase family protein [Patescibacteria group bacterium]
MPDEQNNQNPPPYIRPTWDEYFMEICRQVARRATCDRGRSGCVIVKDRQILTTGYVGSPVGVPHCDEIGHEFHRVINPDGSVSQHCIRTAHAEQNAICQSAKLGIPLEGATLYCKMTPCYACAKMIINVGIKRVVAEKDYHASRLSKEIFDKAGVRLEILDNSVEQYEKQ